MNTNPSFKIIEKSSEECAKINTHNAEAIALGLECSVCPTEKILQQEKAAKFASEYAAAVKSGAAAFLKKLITFLPEDIRVKANITGNGVTFGDSWETRVVVEDYQPVGTWGSPQGSRVVRVVIGHYGNKKILKSKTQNWNMLSVETALIEKVGGEVIGRWADYKRMVESTAAANKSLKATQSFFEQNKEVFAKVGINYHSSLFDAKGGAFGGKIQFVGNSEQWEKLAAFIASMK